MRLHVVLLLAALTLAFQQAPPSPPSPRPIDDWIERPQDAPVDDGSGPPAPEWSVQLADGRVCAAPFERTAPPSGPRPDFSTDTDEMRGATAFCSVDDGWLVGYDHGEFGGALFWFSKDGAQHEKISDHQIVAFLPSADGVLAIEGLWHMSYDRGSLLRIARPAPGWNWVAATLATLPTAPEALVRRDDGMLFIVVSNGVVSVDAGGKVRVIVHGEELRFAHDAVLTPEGHRLYVGTRGFVAQVELDSGRVRQLVPADSQLGKPHKLGAKPGKPKR